VSLNPLSSLPETPLTIKRALLSVSDKEGIIDLAKVLSGAGVELISTGGTAKAIKEAGIEVTDVSEITGFTECLDGRVKTLHPNVHGAILARTSHQPDVDELNSLGIKPIELVVVNLYPFADTVSSSKQTSTATATEYIDIGGPTMIRAAAKNFAHVCVLTSPEQYQQFIGEFEKHQSVSFTNRQQFAREAFNHTAWYDTQIANYFSELTDEYPAPQFNISLPLSHSLRYGENPHQRAAVYGYQDSFIDCFHGKQLSYNNYLDVDAAIHIIHDFWDQDPTCVIIKHTVPCGVATDKQLKKAYLKAFSTDTVSPFGGIVVVNRKLELDTAKEIDKIFTEIIIAPEFSTEALKLLKTKKNRRLIRLKIEVEHSSQTSFRSIFGGLLSQDIDTDSDVERELSVVSKRHPSKSEMNDLLFAWKVVKHIKSNAIVYAKNGQTLGIGTGQTSRVDASEIAVAKAKKENLDLTKSAVASDAFFPFPDGVEAAAKAGATAAIQPGGSIRDEEVIKKADEFNMVMILTGKRHFKH